MSGNEYVENKKGVHLMMGEYTLCGDAFDAPQSEQDWDEGEFRPTTKLTVTCPDCVGIIRSVQGVRTRLAGTK